MPSHYSITEPQPTVRKFAHSGRGGAGNTFKAPKNNNDSTTRTPAQFSEGSLLSTNSKFSSGRGGAGNIHYISEKAIFSFDEELERQNSRDQKVKDGASTHVGRGGAGNWATTRPDSSRKHSTSSGDSEGSNRSGFFGRLSQTFDRH